MAAAVDKDKTAKDLAEHALRGPLKHVAWTDPMGVRLPDVRYALPETTCGECGERVHFWVNRLRTHAEATGELPVMPLCFNCLGVTDIKPTVDECIGICRALARTYKSLTGESNGRT